MSATNIILLILVFSITNCGKRNQESDETVISDVLPELIDSLGIRMSNYVPPPPPLIYDKDTNFIAIDSIEWEKQLMSREQILSRIDIKDPRLLVGLVDTVLTIDLIDLKQGRFADCRLIDRIVKNNQVLDENMVIWKLKLIEVPADYQIILESDLNAQYPSNAEIVDRKFAGTLSLSRGYYDEGNRFGLLLINYDLGYDAISYFVIIEHLEGQWKVKKMLLNWVT